MRPTLSGFHLVNKGEATDHHRASSAGLFMWTCTRSHTELCRPLRAFKGHKDTLTQIHMDGVILGYRYPLTKSPQTRVMCWKFDTKKRREEKSVHFVWNSRFEVSDALELKQNSWLQRTAQVPQGSSWLLFLNIICSTPLCLRGLWLAVRVQEAF